MVWVTAASLSVMDLTGRPKMPRSGLSMVAVRLPSAAAVTCQTMRNCDSPAVRVPCQSPAAGDWAGQRGRRASARIAGMSFVESFIDLPTRAEKFAWSAAFCLWLIEDTGQRRARFWLFRESYAAARGNVPAVFVGRVCGSDCRQWQRF